MSLVSIFATAILPIAAIAVSGYVLGQFRDVSVGPLNTVAVYVLMPALVFHSLVTTDLGGRTLVSIAIAVFLFTGIITLIAGGVGRALGETEPLFGTFVLVSVFANAGNYGIPISEFAFGSVGRAAAVVYIVAQSVAMYTLGVYVAARGTSGDWRGGVRAIFTIPLVYAVVAAIGVRVLGAVPASDTAAMETLQLVGDSAIPVMLLILGIELADTNYGTALRRVTPTVVLKMVVAPIVAIGVALLVDFENATVARVFVLECAMPAAVTTLILTGEFTGPSDDIDPMEYAGTAILVSTIVSVPLLTGLITLLQSGIVI